jgi:hypothetical protein
MYLHCAQSTAINFMDIKSMLPNFLVNFNKRSVMSLSQKNLSSIQKAGQAAHGASVAIAATVRSQAESMVSSVASQPFGAESEQAISRFKSLARLSQGLAAVEKELQSLYSIATELASPASDVISLPAVAKHEATNAAAVDVVAKPVKVKAAKKTGRKASSLTANDSKLLTYLSGVLKGGDPQVLTGSKMAVGAALPLGSVGVSLKKLIASGAIKQVGRGTYALGTATVTATEPVAKSKPVKKIKPVKVEKAAGKKSKASTKAASKSSAPASSDVAPEPEAAPL